MSSLRTTGTSTANMSNIWKKLCIRTHRLLQTRTKQRTNHDWLTTCFPQITALYIHTAITIHHFLNFRLKWIDGKIFRKQIQVPANLAYFRNRLTSARAKRQNLSTERVKQSCKFLWLSHDWFLQCFVLSNNYSPCASGYPQVLPARKFLELPRGMSRQ